MANQQGNFSQYEFSELNPNKENINGVAKLSEATRISKIRQWLDTNLTLVATLSGVLIGVIEGEMTVDGFCSLCY